MSFKLMTNEQVEFTVNPVSYTRMIHEITNELKGTLAARMDALIASGIVVSVAELIMDDIDLREQMLANIANNINYEYVIDRIKSVLATMLVADERFNTLVTRGINNATVGVIDETVERVTARLENHVGENGDQ